MLGLGTWGLSGESYGFISKTKIKNIILNSIKNKIYFLDTAPIYGNGKVEYLLGEILKNSELNKKVIICSKCGMLPHKGLNPKQNFTIKYLKKDIKNIQKRLRRNIIDILLLHSPPVNILKNKKIFSFLKKIKRSGDIKNFGVSLKKPEDLLAISNLKDLDFIEFNFNLMDQRFNQLNLRKIVKKNKIKTICRTPLGFGFLSNKKIKLKNLSRNDHRKYWPKSQINAWNSGKKKFYHFRDKYKFNDLSELAIAFCCNQNFDYVIPGMYNLGEIKKNILASKKKIKDFDLKKIYEIYSNHEKDFFIK